MSNVTYVIIILSQGINDISVGRGFADDYTSIPILEVPVAKHYERQIFNGMFYINHDCQILI